MARRAKSNVKIMVNPKMQAQFQLVFESSFSGMKPLFNNVFLKVFGKASFVRANADLMQMYPELHACAEASHITSILHTGTFNLTGQKLKVFEITLEDDAEMDHSRGNIQRVIRAFGNTYESALMVFHYVTPKDRSWHLSYVERNTFGKNAISHQRLTYVLGSGYAVHIAAEQFARLKKKKNICMDDVREAFSVQAVTTDFYSKLYAWYAWTQSPEFNVTFPTKTEVNDDGRSKLNEHLIRLITRLIFVWFMKQKRLVDEDLFHAEKLKDYLREFDPLAGQNGSHCCPQCEETTNYYHAILQNLFFATLNKKQGARAFAYDGDDEELRKKEYGIKTLYRYEDVFTEKGRDEILRCFNKTPFLNESLFACLDHLEWMSENENQMTYVDGFSRNNTIQDGSFVCRAFVPNILFFNEDKKHPGLITLLRQYDFVVEENTVEEAVVALDPEVLGMVFENLLACNTQKTRGTARSATGSFYTPREIVRCMVEMSLCEYIKTRIAADHTVKIAPDVIDRFFREDSCPEELRDDRDFIKNILLETKVFDPACGSGAFPMGALQSMMELLRKLDPSTEASAYDIKKRIIENCLYGIDIQPLAVQISKLRCYLSLIVQDHSDETKPNCGVSPLPNLETHFVAANALIPLKKNTKKKSTPLDQEVQNIHCEKDNLKRIRDAYFKASSYEEKARHHVEEIASRERLAQCLKASKTVACENIERIQKWNPYDQNQSSEFFDPEWMFNVTDGFDIVIGNPPYGVNMADHERQIYKENYPYLFKKFDIYMVFYALALRLAKCVTCYITPDKWLSKSFALRFRQCEMLPHMSQILHLGNNIFDCAMVDAIITLFKTENCRDLCILQVNSKKEFETVNIIDKTILQEPYLIDQYFQKEQSPIIELLESHKHRLSDYVKCEYASVSPSEAYQLKEFICTNKAPNSNEIAIVNTGLVDKITTRWQTKEMKYLKGKYSYPVVQIHDLLMLFGEGFVKKVTSPKLIIKGLNLLDCSIDIEGRLMSTVGTLNIRSNSIDLLCVIAAIINSSVMTEYCKAKYKSSSYCGGLLFTPDMINEFPVPDLSELENWREIIELVKLYLKEGKNKAHFNEINDLVLRKLVAFSEPV